MREEKRRDICKSLSKGSGKKCPRKENGCGRTCVSNGWIEGNGICTFTVLRFQLFDGLEIFQNKKMRWEKKTKIQSKNKTLGVSEALGSSLSFVIKQRT